MNKTKDQFQGVPELLIALYEYTGHFSYPAYVAKKAGNPLSLSEVQNYQMLYDLWTKESMGYPQSCCLVIVCLFVTSTTSTQRFLEEPADVTARIGETKILGRYGKHDFLF